MKNNRIFYNIFSLCLLFFLSFLLTSCFNTNKNKSESFPVFTSYKKIPGVTAEEISAIEELKKTKNIFIVGMLPSTEAFIDNDGEIGGYSALLCEWLSELFGIKFSAEHFSWYGLLEGLSGGEIDFTCDLTATKERSELYFMTNPISQRSLKLFQLENSPPISEISKTRLPRYILPEKTTIAEDVLFYAGGTFEPVYIIEYDEAYELLKSGKADALVTESVQEAFWDTYGDIEASNFYPLIYSPVSLSAQNPRFAAVISVIQKAIESEGVFYFNELSDRGYREYLKHKLSLHLTNEEIEYIKNNPVISFAAEYDNYPVSFFSPRHNDWQGISIDIIKQIEALTGLSFQIKHNKTEFHDLKDMLEKGDVDIISELVRTEDRENRFIWPNHSFMVERSVLLSKTDLYNININNIHSERIGLNKGTAHAEFFQKFVPNHPKTFIFESLDEAIDALRSGDIDMVMCSNSSLLYLTNYLELSDFKINIMFDNHFESTFGINKELHVLCSIIDKALALIDTDMIAGQWRTRNYDYRLKIEQARTPWLVGFIILSLLILFLIAVLLSRSRRTGKELEVLVEKRTSELEHQKSALSALVESRSAFLANMSHEIRTPMNSIMGVTELLIQNKNIPAEIEDNLDKIYSSCVLLLHILNDILDFSKINDGINVDDAAVNLRQFSDSIVNYGKRERINREPMPYGKVLIVDDVESNLYVAAGMMKLYKIKTDTVTNGLDAVNKIKNNEIYDIIFMDHMMPDMDGMEAVKHIRDFGYTAPIVALTANAVAGQAAVFMQNGFDDFISKPIDTRKLDIILNKYIRDTKPPEVIEAARRRRNEIEVNEESIEVPVDLFIIESFIRDAKKAIEWFNKRMQGTGFYDEKDSKNFTILIHGIKSSLWNIGEKKLSEDAFKLEKGGRERDLKFINESMPEFLKNLRELLTKLERDLKHKKVNDREAKPKISLLKHNIPGLNLKEGLERYENDEKVYLNVLRLYADNVSSILNKIENINSDSLAEYKIGVHSIKGISSEVNADQISRDAKALEDAAKEGNIGYINKHNPAFIKSLRRLIHDIEELLIQFLQYT